MTSGPYQPHAGPTRPDTELGIRLLQAITKTLEEVTQRGKPPDLAARDLRDQVLNLLGER